MSLHGNLATTHILRSYEWSSFLFMMLGPKNCGIFAYLPTGAHILPLCNSTKILNRVPCSDFKTSTNWKPESESIINHHRESALLTETFVMVDAQVKKADFLSALKIVREWRQDILNRQERKFTSCL